MSNIHGDYYVPEQYTCENIFRALQRYNNVKIEDGTKKGQPAEGLDVLLYWLNEHSKHEYSAFQKTGDTTKLQTSLRQYGISAMHGSSHAQEQFKAIFNEHKQLIKRKLKDDYKDFSQIDKDIKPPKAQVNGAHSQPASGKSWCCFKN